MALATVDSNNEQLRSQSVGNFIKTFDLDSQIANRDEQTEGFDLANRASRIKLPYTQQIIESALAQEQSGTNLQTAQTNRFNALLQGELEKQKADIESTRASTGFTKANTGLVDVNTQKALIELPFVAKAIMADLEGKQILNNTNRAAMTIAVSTIGEKVELVKQQVREGKWKLDQAILIGDAIVKEAFAKAGLSEAQAQVAKNTINTSIQQAQATLDATKATTESTRATAERQRQVIGRSTKVSILDEKGNPQVLEMDVDKAIELRKTELANLTELSKEIGRVTKENKKDARDTANELQQTDKIARDAEIALLATGKKALNEKQRPPVVDEFNDNSPTNYIYIIHPKIAPLSGRKIEDELRKEPIPQFTHQITGQQVQLSAKQIAEYARRHNPPLDVKTWMEQVFYPNFRGEKAPWLR